MNKPRVDHEARRAALAECAADGLTQEEAAIRLDLSFWQVQQASKGRAIKWRGNKGNPVMAARAAARREEIRRIGEGLTSDELAERLGLSQSRARELMREAGLPLRRKTDNFGEMNARRAAEAKERRAAEAERLRAAVAEGRTLKAATAHIGMGRCRALALAKEFGIKSSAAARRANASPPPPRPAKAQPAPPSRPNRFRTAAQNAALARAKDKMWTASRQLSPVSDAEAARLVAEHIARRGVTVCPPAACAAVNHGEGFSR